MQPTFTSLSLSACPPVSLPSPATARPTFDRRKGNTTQGRTYTPTTSGGPASTGSTVCSSISSHSGLPSATSRRSFPVRTLVPPGRKIEPTDRPPKPQKSSWKPTSPERPLVILRHGRRAHRGPDVHSRHSFLPRCTVLTIVAAASPSFSVPCPCLSPREGVI